jgi:hypothetical protein
MGFKTVYEGEHAILINRNGALEELKGPRRVLCVLSKLEKLTNYVADLNQYLVIEYVDGRVEHVPGYFPNLLIFNQSLKMF